MRAPRILVVDDEESMRYFLVKALSKKGYEVKAAADGDEALALLARAPADVVLLDLRLPGRDGIEVLAEVKELRPETVVVMMTGYGTVERALEAMRRGAADFVTKPLRVEDVIGKIEEARARGPARPMPAEAAETAPPARPPRPAGAVEPPSRPIVPYLVEAAERRGLSVERSEGGDVPYREAARLFEAIYFMEIIEKTGGNVSVAARLAGISRPSLHRKIHELGIDVERFRR